MSKKKILVIEDEADIMLMLRLSLELEGYQVVGAATGEEGLDRITQDQPDVVILDLTLPGISGWEVIERMRESGAFPALPVIVVSAHADRDTETRCRRLGCAGFLAKPMSTQSLREELERVLGG